MLKRIVMIAYGLFIVVAAYAQTENPQGLQAGTKAPSFVGIDQNGEQISLAEKLKEGPVVVMFYRGAWCPYCNKQLSQMQDSLQLITDQGATVIAVSPEKPENIEKTVKKTDAKFSILHDDGLEIMNAYGLRFTLDKRTDRKYKLFGINVEKANGENGKNLPVPATYIIDQNGKITYAFFDPDYKKRASVQEIADHLQAIQ